MDAVALLPLCAGHTIETNQICMSVWYRCGALQSAAAIVRLNKASCEEDKRGAEVQQETAGKNSGMDWHMQMVSLCSI